MAPWVYSIIFLGAYLCRRGSTLRKNKDGTNFVQEALQKNALNYTNELALHRESLRGQMLRNRYRLERFLHSEGDFEQSQGVFQGQKEEDVPAKGLLVPGVDWPLRHHPRFQGEAHINAGSFEDVWKAYDTEVKEEVAVKIFYAKCASEAENKCDPNYITWDTSTERQKRELKQASTECTLVQDMMKRRKSFEAGASRICECFSEHVSHQSGTDPLFLVLELCGRDLLHLMYKAKPRTMFSKEDAKAIATQVVEGLLFLQTLTPPIVHRDIKLENVNVMPDTPLAIKIIDYGLSIEATENNMRGWAGTPGYIPPEVVVNKRAFSNPPHSFDVYAAGMIYLQLLCANLPQPWKWNWPKPVNMTEEFLEEKMENACPGSNFSRELRMISRMLSNEPSSRPHPYKLLKHGFKRHGRPACGRPRRSQCGSAKMLRPGTSVEVVDNGVKLKASVGGCHEEHYCLHQVDGFTLLANDVRADAVSKLGWSWRFGSRSRQMGSSSSHSGKSGGSGLLEAAAAVATAAATAAAYRDTGNRPAVGAATAADF